MSNTTEEKRKAHMARRRDQGIPLRDLAKEFGTSKSTAHRKTTKAKAKMSLRHGYIDMGSGQ